jgi:hypothetical protein
VESEVCDHDDIDDPAESLLLEVSGDCFKVCGRVSIADVDRSRLLKKNLEIELIDLKLPNRDIDCVQGTWECCARDPQNSAGVGISNVGAVVGVRFHGDLLKLFIRNNWDARVFQQEVVHFDLLSFQICGRLKQHADDHCDL